MKSCSVSSKRGNYAIDSTVKVACYATLRENCKWSKHILCKQF